MNMFVGRELEIGQLMEAWHAAKNGRTVICNIVAEPGLGRTTLLQEFYRKLWALQPEPKCWPPWPSKASSEVNPQIDESSKFGDQGAKMEWLWWGIRWDAPDKGKDISERNAFTRSAEQHIRAIQDERTLRHTLYNLFVSGGIMFVEASVPTLAAFVAATKNLAEVFSASTTVSKIFRSRRVPLFKNRSKTAKDKDEVVAEFLRNSVRKLPLVLVLDNAHYAGEESITFLERFLRDTFPDGHCLVLITSSSPRSSWEENRDPKADKCFSDLMNWAKDGNHVVYIQLKRLNELDSVIAARFPGLTPRQVKNVFQLTSGNPRHAAQIIEYILSHLELFKDKDPTKMLTPLGERALSQVPAIGSLDFERLRIRNLGGTRRRILGICALLGYEFPIDWAETLAVRALGLTNAEFSASFNHLGACHSLVRRDPLKSGWYSFEQAVSHRAAELEYSDIEEEINSAVDLILEMLEEYLYSFGTSEILPEYPLKNLECGLSFLRRRNRDKRGELGSLAVLYAAFLVSEYDDRDQLGALREHWSLIKSFPASLLSSASLPPWCAYRLSIAAIRVGKDDDQEVALGWNAHILPRALKDFSNDPEDEVAIRTARLFLEQRAALTSLTNDQLQILRQCYVQCARIFFRDFDPSYSIDDGPNLKIEMDPGIFFPKDNPLILGAAAVRNELLPVARDFAKVVIVKYVRQSRGPGLQKSARECMSNVMISLGSVYCGMQEKRRGIAMLIAGVRISRENYLDDPEVGLRASKCAVAEVPSGWWGSPSVGKLMEEVEAILTSLDSSLGLGVDFDDVSYELGELLDELEDVGDEASWYASNLRERYFPESDNLARRFT